MSEIAKDPVFRSQYECGVKEDPQVQAALNGEASPVNFKPMPQPAQTQSGFGQMVKLR